MKVAKILFFLPFLLANSISCNRLPNKVNTLYGHFQKETKKVSNIENVNDFISMMDNHQTFVLIQTTKGCECSNTFINNCVNPYIQETGLIIYEADYEIIKNTNYGLALRDNRPTFHLILKGERLGNFEKVDMGSDPFFYEYNVFKNFMNEHTARPSLFEINQNELDNLFLGENKFTIYYAKNKCGECQYLQNVILNDYAQSHFDLKPIYFIDLNKVSLDADQYQLSNKYEWGYGSKGAFPLIHIVDPASKDKSVAIKQGFTFGNDILTDDYKIKESYYTRERLNNIVYASTNTKTKLFQFNKFQESDTRIETTYRTLKNEVNRQRYEPLFKELMAYLNA